MVWLAGAVVLILLVVSAGFRKFALGLVVFAALAGGIAGGIAYVYNKREESRSLSRISASEVIIKNVTLMRDHGGYKISGRVHNNSAKFTLKQLTFVVTMQDCTGENPEQECVTIGESVESPYLAIPPSQARDFDESVYFSGDPLKPKGHLVWSYTVLQIEGE